eukprot:6490469-Amphidinium_carterae.1
MLLKTATDNYAAMLMGVDVGLQTVLGNDVPELVDGIANVVKEVDVLEEVLGDDLRSAVGGCPRDAMSILSACGLNRVQAVLDDDVPELVDANVVKEVELDVREDMLGNVGVVELVAANVPVDVDVVPLAVLGNDVPELCRLMPMTQKEVVTFVLKEVLSDVGVVELVVLVVEVEGDLFVFEDVPVDIDVVTQAVLGDDVPELVDANVVKEVDALEEILGDVGVVELEVLAVEVEGDLFVFEDVPVDVEEAQAILEHKARLAAAGGLLWNTQTKVLPQAGRAPTYSPNNNYYVTVFICSQLNVSNTGRGASQPFTRSFSSICMVNFTLL